jgi:hypothetical protein
LNYVRQRRRGIERRGVVLRCLECREREMCFKCLKYVREREREREEGVLFLSALEVWRERH